MQIFKWHWTMFAVKRGFFRGLLLFAVFAVRPSTAKIKKPRKLGMVRALVNTTILKVTSALFIHSSSFLLENRMFVTVFTWNVVILKYVPSHKCIQIFWVALHTAKIKKPRKAKTHKTVKNSSPRKKTALEYLSRFTFQSSPL